MLKMKLNQNMYLDKKNMYKYRYVQFNEGFTVLVGCNGSGKTTMLAQIAKYCDKEKIKYLEYDNLNNGGKDAMQSFHNFDEMSEFTQYLISSEGERISQNICRIARNIGRLVSRAMPKEKVVILFDAVDSGLSIDGIMDIKKHLIHFACNDAKKRGVEIYFIVAANSYELASNEDCLCVRNGKHRIFKSYNSYKSEILRSYREKMERYDFDPQF